MGAPTHRRSAHHIWDPWIQGFVSVGSEFGISIPPIPVHIKSSLGGLPNFGSNKFMFMFYNQSKFNGKNKSTYSYVFYFLVLKLSDSDSTLSEHLTLKHLGKPSKKE